MRGRKGTRRWRGEILTDTKKPCQFLSGAWDKINSPLFQTGRPYQFPADTGQIQIQPVNKSKSNTCNKSCWPPRTNPAAAASDKSKCVRWTNRICAPTQIRALRPGPCKGGAPPGLGWNIREHFAAWQRHFDTKDHIEIWGYFEESLRKFWLNAFFLHGKELKKNLFVLPFLLPFLFRVQKETSSDSLVQIVGRFERWEKEQLLWFSHPLTGFSAECLQLRKRRAMKRWKDKLPPVSWHISFYSRGWMKERTCGYAENIERERERWEWTASAGGAAVEWGILPVSTERHWLDTGQNHPMVGHHITHWRKAHNLPGFPSSADEEEVGFSQRKQFRSKSKLSGKQECYMLPLTSKLD